MCLAGFSTHYKISFDLPPTEQGSNRTVDRLAYLLANSSVSGNAARRQPALHGNRGSPRGYRIEITAAFTPDAPLMIATATVIVGIVREVMTWPSTRSALSRRPTSR